MLNVIPGSQLLETQRLEGIKKAKEKDSLTKDEAELQTNLTQYVRARWTDALFAKRDIENQMLKNKRQRNGEYEAQKLAAIRAMGSAEPFIMLTDTKCRSGLAWIKDVLFQPGTKPWSLEPTPNPELPDELKTSVMQKFINHLMMTSAQQAEMSGQQFDPSSVMQYMQSNKADIDISLSKEYFRAAKDRAVYAEKFIDDQLEEGNWYSALEECLYDLVELKAGVLKGPILRKEKMRVKQFDPKTGQSNFDVIEKIIPKYERRSPFDIYPSPGSSGVNDGYLFDKIQLTRKTLYDLIGIPGFNEKEVRAVISEFETGALREWTNIESERASAEGKDSTSIFKLEIVDCLEFWHFIPGKLLLEWGLKDDDIKDPDDSYAACVWLIGNHIIKAMLNYDRFGDKPFHVTSFDSSNDNFWGKGIPELIDDIQGVCNAVARAIVNNVGLASGPQIEINRSRFPVGFPTQLWPWKVWESTDAGFSTTPAIKVNHIPLNADKLIQIYNHFSKLADEESGVPAYSHGDPQVGGGGNTASGLSMLMTQAARGIKNVIRMIDVKIISPSIKSLYYLDMEMEDNQDFVFDMHIIARGSSSLIAKEQQATRLTEFLNTTNNPVDMQIIGLEGRKNLLEQAAKANEIDTDKIIPEELIPPQLPMNQDQSGGQDTTGNSAMATRGHPNQPGNPAMDQAGNPAQGENMRLLPQSTVPQMRADGGPVDPNQPYIVGERGPEVIVPQTPGHVIPNYGLRPDGTPKGQGWLGAFPTTSGNTMTEFSVGLPIMGQQRDVPSFVPGLKQNEIDYLTQNKPHKGMWDHPIGRSIIDKAKNHAEERIKQGLSPFVD